MNGEEYAHLLKLVTETHTQMGLCVQRLDGLEKGVDKLQTKVEDNAAAVAAGKAGVRVVAWLGGIAIGLGAVAVSALALFGGTDG